MFLVCGGCSSSLHWCPSRGDNGRQQFLSASSVSSVSWLGLTFCFPGEHSGDYVPAPLRWFEKDLAISTSIIISTSVCTWLRFPDELGRYLRFDVFFFVGHCVPIVVGRSAGRYACIVFWWWIVLKAGLLGGYIYTDMVRSFVSGSCLFGAHLPEECVRGFFWKTTSGFIPVFSAIWVDSGYMFASVQRPRGFHAFSA